MNVFTCIIKSFSFQTPRHSARSPTQVESPRLVQMSGEDNPADTGPPPARLSGNSTTLTNVTSVWDSFNSVRGMRLEDFRFTGWNSCFLLMFIVAV